MKNKKSIILLASAVVATGVIALSGCGDNSNISIEKSILSAPTNVVINYGDDTYASDDDTVTCNVVENASSYRVFVYEEGAETAKVTEATAEEGASTVTIDMPNDLTAGTYQVSVQAVGDAVTYYNSLGTEATTYTLEELVQTKLDEVTNLSLDMESGTISFTGVDNALKYMVNIYSVDSDHAVADDAEPVTYFNIAASSTDIVYEMTEEVMDNLGPSYYTVTVTSIGDGYYYSDSDEATFTTNCDYIGVQLAKPQVDVTSDNSGVKVAVSNYSDYAVGQTFNVNVYSDEACTSLVKTVSFNYSTSEFFGQIQVTNSTTMTDLTVGETYYIVVEAYGNGVVTIPDTADMASAVAEEVTNAGGGGGQPGGGGGFPG